MSYCWDRAEFLQLTTANYSTILPGVATKKPPITFQDAVRVCHALTIRHLWINALCIIQGPDGGFGTKLGRMASVYLCSHLCITATWGKITLFGHFNQPPLDARHSVIQADGITFTAFFNWSQLEFRRRRDYTSGKEAGFARKLYSLPVPSFLPWAVSGTSVARLCEGTSSQSWDRQLGV